MLLLLSHLLSTHHNLPSLPLVLPKKAVPSEVNEQGFVFDDVITITGTFDHRVIDGALGGEWMKELKRIVENPLEMLI